MYTNDHRGQLIADVISNSDHITLNTKHQPECQTPHYNKHLHQISPRCITHYTVRHHGQRNTHYHQTTYLSSPQLTYDKTTDYNKTDRHSPTTRKLTEHNSQKTHSLLSLRPPYTDNIIFTNIIPMAEKGKMYRNCRLLPEDIVCKSHKEP